ncbi:MAG TPA: hypothetical protein VJ782_01860 [Aeromicrobium sp.]|nr:hypothetical protein [Aeromicrobium sp.]
METNNEKRLPRLIAESGMSTRDIALRAQQFGKKLSHSKVHEWARGVAVKAPDREQIEALAAGLGIDPQTVWSAVSNDWYGWEPTMGEPFMESRSPSTRSFLRFAGLALDRISDDEFTEDLTRQILARLEAQPNG